MKDSEILETAAEIVSQGYCKDGYAKDVNSQRVGVMDPRAITFDLLGSISRALGGSIMKADEIVDKWVLPLLPRRLTPWGNTVSTGIAEKAPQVRESNITPRAWNDYPSTSQGDVVSKLKEAAKRAAEKGE